MKSLLALVVAASLGAGAATFAGPGDDPLAQARGFISQKQYERVDAALAPLLAQRSPPPEALRLSLDAALAGGRLVTAQNRINALLRAPENPDTRLVLLGAQIADRAGDSRTALVRYLAYARRADAKATDPQQAADLASALRYVLHREAYPDEYKKYVAAVGPTDSAWRLGVAQFTRLAEAPDGGRALDLTAFLLHAFPAPEKVTQIHTLVRSAAEAFVFGKELKDRYVKPLRALVAGPTPGSYAQVEALYQEASPALTEEERARLVLDLMGGAAGPIPNNMVYGLGQSLRALKTEDARLAAGREMLSHEAAYAAPALDASSASADPYFWFFRTIGESPTVFALKDRALVSGAQLVQKYDALKARPGERASQLQEAIQWTEQSYLAQVPPARVAFLRQNLPLLNGSELNDLLSLTKGENLAATLADWSKGKTFKQALDVRVQSMPYFAAAKDKEALRSAAADYLHAYPTTFNKDQIAQQVVGSALLSDDEKLALLRDAIARAGATAPMRELLSAMASDAAHWAKSAPFVQLKAAFDKNPPAADPAARALAALAAIPAAPQQPVPAVTAVVSRFLAEFKGDIPAGEESLASADDVLLQQVFAAHAAHVSQSAAGVGAWAEAWAPRLPLGSNWQTLTARVREYQLRTTLAKLVAPYAARVRAGVKEAGNDGARGSAIVWQSLAGAAGPDAQSPSPLAEAYDLMGTDLAAQYVFDRRQEWDSRRPYMVQQIVNIASIPRARFDNPALAAQWLSHLYDLAQTTGVQVPPTLVASLWQAYQAGVDKSAANESLQAEGRAYGTLLQGKQNAEAERHLLAYLDWIKTRPARRQLAALHELIRWATPPTEAGSGLQPGHLHHLLLRVMKPLIESLPPEEWETLSIHQTVASTVSAMATAAPADPKAQLTPEARALRDEAIAMGRLLIGALEAGAKFDGQPSVLAPVGELLARSAIDRGDWAEVNRLCAALAHLYAGDSLDSAYTQTLAPLFKKLEDAGASETLYTFAAALLREGKPSEAASKQLMLARAKAAAMIPGLIPVAANDPSHDLYAAAVALAGGDEARAWELTAPRLKLLTANWENFDARYVAWSVDQMRKQKLLKEALDFAFNVLLRESDLEPDVAARVQLSKGDVYKDQENYQAARVEYESLRGNSRYAKTDAGARAVYRLIELHILTKDYSAAEGLLERLVNSNDVRAQAEANYLYARMAFEQGQFKEAHDYLKKVKDRVSNHVEAALLEGELNLRLPGGLANTEVAVGDPRLSTVVIPGRYLTLALQDPNLSVARGGSAIPVIVTTSKGGDVEHVKLLPAASNKTLFTARIATALGKAVKDNLTLELCGADVVSYVIDPEFQKANDLHYPPKDFEVRSDARLVASSGEILSEEEEEKRALETQLQARRAASRRFDVARDGRTIRPGSKIYVQVTDADQDVSDGPDAVRVDLRTSSGGVLEGVALTETGPHTGVFRGSVPTGVPAPRATASDTEEGRTANPVLSDDGGGWSSLGDGKKPKWIEVDTMGSQEVGSVTLTVPALDSLKEVTFEGMLADEYETLAAFPASAGAARGGLTLDVAAEQSGETVEQMKRYLKRATTATTAQPSPELDRAATAFKGKDGWTTARLRGTFWVPENRTLEIKFLQPPPSQDWQRVHVLIDGQPVLHGHNAQTAPLTGKIDLVKGPHTFELLARDYSKDEKIVVGYRKDDGTFEPIPADWFSTSARPELAEALRPKGKITADAGVLKLTLDHPQRLRKVRVTFNDFTGTAVAVRRFEIDDADGKPIVPASQAGSQGPSAGVLPVAPGDQIVVAYNDVKRLRGPAKAVTSNLNSSYYNGTITLAEEVLRSDPNDPTQRRAEYLEARRCRAGDQLAVIVTDYDEDTSDARDTVDVKVTTSAGESMTLKALETARPDVGEEPEHAGRFLAVLKFGDKTDKDTIRVSTGDRITVSYLDKENTKPGIPVERSYSVQEAGSAPPQTLVYRTNIKMVPDASPEAAAKLKRLAGREAKGTLFKPLVVARHPQYVAAGAEAAEAATRPAPPPGVVASVSAPLLFEINYPKRALNLGSTLEVTAVAESELAAAKAENRPPTVLKVPTFVEGIEKLAAIKGYPIQLQSQIRRNALEMLKDGSFAGIIRLQVGSRGDPLDDVVTNGEGQFASEEQRQGDASGLLYKVPTLLVSGSDVVHLRVKDEAAGTEVVTNVRLLSDGRLELMDRSFVVENESIHVGEKFYVRVTDPDQDVSNERDVVRVRVRTGGGESLLLPLTETLPHSGVFTATLTPELKSAATVPATRAATQAAEPVEAVIGVHFGEEVTFEYEDAQSVLSQSPVMLSKVGRILLGSDAKLAVFTKKFKDPEIAVKTRFLMAEALFETAKEHRKIAETKQAEEEIARGKTILEEAIRDYPDTSLAAQGEYLLANLAQELGNYQEAVGRYSNVISTWGESDYAPQSQFKMALCFEKMGKYDQACEEYVKLTYIYSDSPLVADATIRLGNYYYKQQSFKIASKVFFNFQQKNPQHRLAAEALFLAAQCQYKLADYKESAKLFEKVAGDYPEDKNVRPEAMYWLGDSFVKGNENLKAYQWLKKVTWDYPDSKWAKVARGRLTEEAFSNMHDEQ